MNKRAVALTAAVEGLLDESVVARIARELRVELGAVHGNRRGVGYVLSQLSGYNHAADHAPWLVIADLDAGRCAPEFVASHLPRAAQFMCLRIAVRKAEAWLMGDQERLARCLAVKTSLIPDDPESLDDPKAVMVHLAGESRSKTVKEEMTPRPGSGHSTGPAYTARLVRFITDPEVGWRPAEAATRVDSLSRCMRRLAECLDRYDAWLAAQ